MDNAKNEQFFAVKFVKIRCLGNPATSVRRISRSSSALKRHSAPDFGAFYDSKQPSRYCFLPAFRQPMVSLAFIPVSLLKNIGNRRIAKDDSLALHRRRVRSRNAVTKPLLRISVTESSIFGPFAAVMSSCSRLDKRRSLSCRINSRTYSLGVPQSPEATWPSIYFLSASGSEMLSDVIGIHHIMTFYEGTSKPGC
jgi:hypothetical protein